MSNINVNPKLVHPWLRMFLTEGDSESVGKEDVKPEYAEFKRLRRGLDEVKGERDIFIKPWTSFPNGSERYRTRDEVKLSIFEYAEVFCNRIRMHSALGYKNLEQHANDMCYIEV
jgi:hypothetical protein